MKFVWQMLCPPVNCASLGNYFCAEISKIHHILWKILPYSFILQCFEPSSGQILSLNSFVIHWQIIKKLENILNSGREANYFFVHESKQLYYQARNQEHIQLLLKSPFEMVHLFLHLLTECPPKILSDPEIQYSITLKNI